MSIAVFAYNRPKHLALCLKALERSQNYLGYRLPVIIYCDGAKKQEHLPAIEETRNVAKSYPGATVIIREKNYGFRNIVEGITEQCEAQDSVIVIEDDVVVAPDFLPYMCQSLKKYADDSRVYAITGFMYFDAQPKDPQLFFLPYATCWGWATWKRAWKHFEWEPKGWQDYLNNRRNRYFYNCLGTFPFAKMFEKSVTKVWDTWDCQWMFSVAQRGGLVLTPHQSLTWNSGSGGGTHGDASRNAELHLAIHEHYIHGNLTLEDFQVPRLDPDYVFPSTLSYDMRAMRRLGVCLLQERLRREKKKRWRLYVKLFYHKFYCQLDFIIINVKFYLKRVLEKVIQAYRSNPK